jgi:hypothetical protein
VPRPPSSTAYPPALDQQQAVTLRPSKLVEEKTPMARKVHTSFTKFQALVGAWDHVAEGADHRSVTV